MRLSLANAVRILTLGMFVFASGLQAQEKLVIAHRGASAYLPEHSMEAKVLAHAMGADYIEQDVVMTADNELVVMHDLTLDRTTDVAARFAQRKRPDGHYYVIDFSLAELRQLKLSEGFIRRDGNTPQAVFPDRFPLWQGHFTIHTLAEEIEVIQALNRLTGRRTGIYTEIKSPWFHRQAGKDLSLAVLETLKSYGYDSKQAPVYLQSFDFNEIKRIHDELMPVLDMDLKLVQLIAENDWLETYELNAEGELQAYDYNWMYQAEGLRRLASYVDGIGPNLAMIINPASSRNIKINTTLVSMAHAAGLVVHPYTFRADAAALPAYVGDFEQLLELFLIQQDVDGVFTDNPDRAVQFLQNRTIH